MNNDLTRADTEKIQARRSRRRFAAALLVGTIGAAIGPAFAATGGDPSATTYTGCLRIAGDQVGSLVAIKEGGSPLRVCTSEEKKVAVSGGDITGVVPGTGIQLTPGSPADMFGVMGVAGNVGLQLAPTYRLPQACSPGQPAESTAGGGWACGSDDGAVVHIGVAKSDDAHLGDLISYYGSTIGGKLPVPPGKWSISAKLEFNDMSGGEHEGTYVECNLYGGGQGLVLDRAEASGPEGLSGTLILVGSIVLYGDSDLWVRCTDSSRGTSEWETGTRWKNLKITATQATTLTTVNLS